MERIEWKFERDPELVLPAGPWDDEPDKVQWPDETTGLACMIRRNPVLGMWCGYVGIDDTHPLYGTNPFTPTMAAFNVHGGINYGGECDGDEEHGVCHVAGPGEPEPLWWFGFDCGRTWDLIPRIAYDSLFAPLHGDESPRWTYRDQSYVTREVELLARQLARAR